MDHEANKVMGSHEDLLTTEQNVRLDQLLIQWRQRHRLSAEVAEQIRHNALAATESLPDEWWATFEEQMSWLFVAVNQLPLWMTDASGGDQQAQQLQWKPTNYQRDYWRPATL